jgi:hypothetical protein
MRSRLAAWRPMHLLATWCVYWVALALWALGPALPALWRATRPDARGSVSASVGDGVARLTVTADAATVWTGQVGLGTLALWVALPPLLLSVIWLLTRRRTASTTAAEPVGARSSDRAV